MYLEEGCTVIAEQYKRNKCSSRAQKLISQKTFGTTLHIQSPLTGLNRCTQIWEHTNTLFHAIKSICLGASEKCDAAQWADLKIYLFFQSLSLVTLSDLMLLQKQTKHPMNLNTQAHAHTKLSYRNHKGVSQAAIWSVAWDTVLSLSPSANWLSANGGIK